MPYVYCEYEEKTTSLTIYFENQLPSAPEPSEHAAGKKGGWFEINREQYRDSSSLAQNDFNEFRRWSQLGLVGMNTRGSKIWADNVRAELDIPANVRPKIQVLNERQFGGRFGEPVRDKDLAKLRNFTVQFANQLYGEMHKYCDQITSSPEKSAVGALHGSFENNGSEAWNTMMSCGPIAGFMAANLETAEKIMREWDKYRGKAIPTKLAVSTDLKADSKICEEALMYASASLKALLNGLAQDDRTLRSSTDVQRRNEFREWAKDAITILQKIADAAKGSLPEKDKAANELASALSLEQKETGRELHDVEAHQHTTSSSQLAAPSAPAPTVTLEEVKKIGGALDEAEAHQHITSSSQHAAPSAPATSCFTIARSILWASPASFTFSAVAWRIQYWRLSTKFN